jgi:hypothetical protein
LKLAFGGSIDRVRKRFRGAKLQKLGVVFHGVSA